MSDRIKYNLSRMVNKLIYNFNNFDDIRGCTDIWFSGPIPLIVKILHHPSNEN